MPDSDYNDIPQTDEEWDAAVKGLSDDELIAYLRRVHDTMTNNREAYPGITDEMLAELKTGGDGFEASVRKVEIAEREEAIARKVVEHSADQILRALPDNKKGN